KVERKPAPEEKKPDPSLPPILVLKLDDISVPVQAGQKAGVGVRVERQRCKGEVELAVSGLPPNVRALPVRVPEDKDRVRLELVADEDAEPKNHTVQVQARLGSLQTEQALRVEVKVTPWLRLLV